MKRSLTYVLTVLALVVSLAVSCNKDRARVIPRSKLAKIYAEMFITDQWIQNTPNVRTIADTSLVYEPILQKYGFTSEDYQHSVNHYMNDPERFSRILRTTSDILDQKIKDLCVLAQLQAEAKEKAKMNGVKRSDVFVKVNGLWVKEKYLKMAMDVIEETIHPDNVVRNLYFYGNNDGEEVLVSWHPGFDIVADNDTIVFWNKKNGLVFSC